MADAKRPEAPILDVDERKDIKAFYHNVAYKTGRVHINIEKMKILKERLQECVRKEGVNYIDRCDQLAKRYQAIVRVCQWSEGTNQRPRDVAGILDAERKMAAEAAGANLATA